MRALMLERRRFLPRLRQCPCMGSRALEGADRERASHIILGGPDEFREGRIVSRHMREENRGFLR